MSFEPHLLELQLFYVYNIPNHWFNKSWNLWNCKEFILSKKLKTESAIGLLLFWYLVLFTVRFWFKPDVDRNWDFIVFLFDPTRINIKNNQEVYFNNNKFLFFYDYDSHQFLTYIIWMSYCFVLEEYVSKK